MSGSNLILSDSDRLRWCLTFQMLMFMITITIIIVITLEVGSWGKLRPQILIHVSPSPGGSMAIGSQAGEGDLAFSIIKPRVPKGLDKGKSLTKPSVSYALVIEALIEAFLNQTPIFKVLYVLHPFYNGKITEAHFEASLDEPRCLLDPCVSHTCYNA